MEGESSMPKKPRPPLTVVWTNDTPENLVEGQHRIAQLRVSKVEEVAHDLEKLIVSGEDLSQGSRGEEQIRSGITVIFVCIGDSLVERKENAPLLSKLYPNVTNLLLRLMEEKPEHVAAIPGFWDALRK